MLPPHPKPAQQAAAEIEIDPMGVETECPDCGAIEVHLTPIIRFCRTCEKSRSLVKKPLRDEAKDNLIRREIITANQQLRARGVSKTDRASIRARLEDLESQLK
jgi:hypothetical protein